MDHADLLRLDAAARLSPAELRTENPELLKRLQEVEANRAKEAVVERFADAPVELRDAVTRLDVPVADGIAVRGRVVEDLRVSGLREADVAEAAERLATIPATTLLEDNIPLAANPQLMGDLAVARVHRLVSISKVADAKAAAITARGITETTIDDDTLTGLVEVGAIDDDDANELGATVGIYRVLDGDPALTEKVMKAQFGGVPGGKVTAPEDLVHLTDKDWLKVVKGANGSEPGGLTEEQQAIVLSKRAALAFPTAAMVARAQPVEATKLSSLIDKAQPALDDGGVIMNGADVGDRPKAVRDAVHELRRIAHGMPGLGLDEVLESTGLSASERVEKVNERIALVGKLAEANPDTELLGLDMSVGSDDVAAIKFTGIAKGEQPYALAAVKAQQRLLALVQDPHDVDVVSRAGFGSGVSILSVDLDEFTAKTGLDAPVAAQYYAQAASSGSQTGSAVLSIIDALRGGFSLLNVANLGPGIENYFRTIDGWEDLFGSQDFCACKHCSSILGPAAYFVDLMQFLETSLTSKVFVGADAGHVLALKTRRPDLWTLPLTCENTKTRIPLLVIVNEILENYIAKLEGYAGPLSDRAAIWRRVYRDRLQSTVSSFGQPFVLPLTRLEIYLEHFEQTRARIAYAIGMNADVVAGAALSFSKTERDFVIAANSTQAFLRDVYDVNFAFVVGGGVEPLDAQLLLKAIGVTRDELGALLGGSFVQAGTTEAVEVGSERSSTDSVQNDIERVHGLRQSSLDRLHRFTRLWRATGWTPRELDLTLTHLGHAGLATGIDPGALRGVEQIQSLAKRFRLDVEETTALYDVLPTTPVEDNTPALFSRLFNLDDFVKLDGTYPKDTTDFIHPALRTNPGAPAADHALPRLLAGLQVDADQLYELILGLAQPLGADPLAAAEADRGFSLSVANLSLLHRHALLARLLNLSMRDLFRTAALVPTIAGDHVANLAELLALVDFRDWLKGSKLTLDDVAYVMGQPVSEAARYPTSADVTRNIVDRVTADDPLTFTESLFTFVDGVSEADSRAIFTANAASFVAAGDSMYRLADDFDPTAALALPASSTAAELELRALLLSRHASQLVPTYLASELKVDVPVRASDDLRRSARRSSPSAPHAPHQSKAQALVALAGADLADPDLAIALRDPDTLTPLEEIVETVLRLGVLLKGPAFDHTSIDFVRANPDVFALTAVTTPTVDALRKLDVYRQLSSKGDDWPADLRAVLGGFDATDRFKNADQDALARVLEVDAAVSSSLQAHLTLPTTAIDALTMLRNAARIAAYLGVDGGTLHDIVDTDYDRLDAAANAVLAAFRAKYRVESKWRALIEEFDARILDARRDALCDYLVHTNQPQFKTRADLTRYFLVDVDVAGCFTTSRVVSATSSVQLYVHRVLMNLEQDRTGQIHVLPSLVPLEEWDWRKHYRVWEWNRKVFVWTENYLFPDLRDDKTHLFDELAKELLQNELDEDSVLDLYSKYLDGFQEVASLKIAGSYHDVDLAGQTDALHLIGVTPGDPPSYYYRRVDNARFGETVDGKSVVWGPWLRMDVAIPVRRVAPVVHNGRLHVFWIEIVSSPQNHVSNGQSRFVGYTHKLALKYSTLRLDGRWTAPQKLSLYGRYPFLESDGVIDDPLMEPDDWADFKKAIDDMATFGVFSNPAAKLLGTVQNMITPRYDTVPHTTARDGYTLTGLEWEQVYPDLDGNLLMITGAGYQFVSAIDLFGKKTLETGGWNRGRIRLIDRGLSDERLDDIAPGSASRRPPSPLLGVKGGTLWSGTLKTAPWGDYAIAALIADAERYERVLKEWTADQLNSTSTGAWATRLGSVSSSAELLPINGSLSDGVLDVNGDLYLLQSSVRDGAHWLLQRLGTTLAETVSRALFSHGADGLLDLGTQKQLKELPRNFSIDSTKIEDRVVAGEIDYTGPYGVYYREIFLHIPFLIAQTLNAQGKYAEAQRWYQFLFNPTSSEIVKDDPALDAAGNAARKRDRNWRYLEFRGLGLPVLRKILTDAKAIDAYKTDPFNPHAIARQRLSAYQKAIVMRYIDNLLDWADELFTQFQSETVNEALMLYATAADILGDRPAVLGDCGEGVISPKTYEAIVPFMGKGSDFITELEHWTYVKQQRTYTGKKKRKGFTVSPSKATSITDDVFTLPQVKNAGIVSRNAMQKVVLQADAGGEIDSKAAQRFVADRLRAEGGVAIGSSGEPDAAAPTTERLLTTVPLVGVMAMNLGMAVDGTNLEAKSGLFADDLTNSVRWKELTASGHESRYLPAADHRVKSLVAKAPGTHSRVVWSIMRQVGPAFCVPQNKDLLEYWNRLENRLYKIRNCMDITGARRELSLFAPEIDPMMLVRARAAGLSLDDVLDALGGELPPYRFAFLLEKAKAFAVTVQSFGSALLGALERQDTEELNELRVVHQKELLALTTDVRTWEYKSASNAVEALEQRRASIQHRHDYFEQLVRTGLNAEEWTQRIMRQLSTSIRSTEGVLDIVAGVTHLIPQLGSPFAMKYGGSEIGTSMSNFAGAMRTVADIADLVGGLAAMEAGFSRREQGWKRDLEAATDDLLELDKQIEGAKIRRDIAERSIKLHTKTLEQTEEVLEMFRDRFTNVGLYTWLATETQRLYREAYNATYALARLTERAYRYERDDDQSVGLQATYWDASRAGLRAGERLLIDLQRMERRYLETNYRTFEVDQSFSLLQLAPAALIELRQTGRCEFTIPEMAFDTVYPGHYRRRIRSVRLTIPSITGPYTNVSATLELLENSVRREPQLGTDNLARMPLPRTSSIATSSAQNDGGVFELSFRDDRYLPFEGAGAVSRWSLELPKNFRQFDYQTINDVILSISYTSLHDGALRGEVEKLIGAVEGAIIDVLQNEPMGRLFSLRQDFSTAFGRLVHSGVNMPVTFEITDKHFPAILVNRDLDIVSATMIIRTIDDPDVSDLQLKLNGDDVTGFAGNPEFADLPTAALVGRFGSGIVGVHTIEIDHAGDLAPDQAPPGDDSALDESKIADILLYVETKVT